MFIPMSGFKYKLNVYLPGFNVYKLNVYLPMSGFNDKCLPFQVLMYTN